MSEENEIQGALEPGRDAAIRGRGAAENPGNRFEKVHVVADEPDPDQPSRPRTQFLRDASRSIIAHNKSPDVGFEYSINPYRGCEHGCVYCYARPTHEYLGFSAGLDFETRIRVKEDAPELLRRELASPKWEPRLISISGVTDCYQPVERKLELTRRCLGVLAECLNPCFIVTKNHLVTRDADYLGKLAAHDAAGVMLSITTLDDELCGVLEPRTSRPRARLDAIRELTRAGIPAGVMMAPVIPGLTEHEMPAILAEAAKAGARFAGFVPLRLPYGLAALFEAWLTRHRPERKDKVLNRIRELRGGKLNDSSFGSRMRGEGVFAKQLQMMFKVASKRAGLDGPFPKISTAAFRRPPPPPKTIDGQMTLF